MNPKILLCLLIFILSTYSSGALSVSAPDEIPANVNWSFSVELNPTDSFDETSVIMDSIKVATVYSNSQVAVDPYHGDFVLGAFLYDKDPNSTTGLTVYISYFGLDAGDHKIEVKSYKGDSVVDETGKPVRIFNAVGSIGGLETRLGVVESAIDALDFRTRSMKADDEVFFESLNRHTADLNSLREELLSVREGLASMESNYGQANSGLSELRSRLEGMERELRALQSSLTKLSESFAEKEESEKPVAGITGLLGLSASNLPAIAAGIIIIAVLAILAFLFSHGRFSLYARATERDPFDSSRPLVGKSTGQETPQSKWAYRGEGKE